MKHIVLNVAVSTAAVGAVAAGWFVASRGTIETGIVKTVVEAVTTQSTDSDASEATTAFFYQDVGPMSDNVGHNSVRAGTTSDGIRVSGSEREMFDWYFGTGYVGYGDPVVSLLPSGNWALTARTNHDGNGFGTERNMYYGESACPSFAPENVHEITPSSAEGCSPTETLTGGKTSEIFTFNEEQYVLHMSNGGVRLAKIGDATHSTKELDEICVLEQQVESVDDLNIGDSTLIIFDEDRFVSDTGIARREDGTWVVFVKGIAKDAQCEPNTLCELCGRSIYRTTSTDLISWTPLELVVEQASVPEAYTAPDGKVWVYWQDFSDVCAEEDQKLAAISPISGAYETDDSFTLSAPERVVFSDETFAGHYPTNANPVALRTGVVREAFAACIGE
jgi:hypothetical protein